MKVLFAVSNNEKSKDDIVEAILDEYQKTYKKIVSYKRAFYYDAIINEIKQTRRDSRYDLIILSEDLEKNINDTHEFEDLNLYLHMDLLTDEAYKEDGTAIPIILICNDRRSNRDAIISKLFSLGMYNILLGKERTIQKVCELMEHPRNKKEAKISYNINPNTIDYESGSNIEKTLSDKELLSILKFFNVNKDKVDKCVRGFAKLSREMNEKQLNKIINNLPLDVKLILEENSKEYIKVAKESVKQKFEQENKMTVETRDLTNRDGISGQNVIIPNQMGRKGIFKKANGEN